MEILSFIQSNFITKINQHSANSYNLHHNSTWSNDAIQRRFKKGF